MMQGFFVMQKFKEITPQYIITAKKMLNSIHIDSSKVHRSDLNLLIFTGTVEQERYVKIHLDQLMDETIEKCSFVTIEYRKDLSKDVGRFVVLEYFTNTEKMRLRSASAAISYCSRMKYNVKKMKDCFMLTEEF